MELVAGEGGHREGEPAQGGAVDEGHDRDGRVGALVGGHLAVERYEVRGVFRRDEPVAPALVLVLVRALLGLVGCRELCPVGLMVASGQYMAVYGLYGLYIDLYGYIRTAGLYTDPI